jgi:hypothetical protein
LMALACKKLQEFFTYFVAGHGSLKFAREWKT